MEIIFLVLVLAALVGVVVYAHFDNKRCESDMQELIDSAFDSLMKMFERI
ncbi:hypothetical protein [Nitrosomonas marina]|uniref:Uncharacterized protein n=1 Tax=Nitrosomonas marina TaxID=917 RepID=A0A1H8J6T9_9PROT|nr:hypothetical protein [Nitrosomonas marina]SEN76185.1 hypothetical protein SAMN05216325_1574 [Nitrosomonas marina]